MISQFLLFLHLLISVTLVGLIVLQQGGGSDISANFGGGGSQTLFGSRGSASFLSKVTAILMGLFFLTSLGLGYVMGHSQTLKQRLSTNTVKPSHHHHLPMKK